MKDVATGEELCGFWTASQLKLIEARPSEERQRPTQPDSTNLGDTNNNADDDDDCVPLLEENETTVVLESNANDEGK